MTSMKENPVQHQWEAANFLQQVLAGSTLFANAQFLGHQLNYFSATM